MSSGFDEFTEAVSKSTTKKPVIESKSFSRIAVLGGGADARLIAALCLSEGAEVKLFSAYGEELSALRSSSGVTLRGAGPVGTYHVDREDGPSIRTTAELDGAVTDAELIFLTGPVHKQRTYSMVLADHLKDGQVLVVAPGRSLGALETAWLLRIGGCTADVTIVEAQGLPYWYDEAGSILTLSQVAPMPAATLPSGRPEILSALKKYLPNLVMFDSVLGSGFSDGSALVEVPTLLMGGPSLQSGAASIPMGGQYLENNRTFASLIGPAHKAVISKLTEERHLVAKSFGIRNLPSSDEMIDTYGGSLRGDYSRPIPSHQMSKSLLRCGVIGSLVPLKSAGNIANVQVPVTTAIITLASSVLGADVSAAGRRLEAIGIDSGDIDTARRAMDAIATGEKYGR